MHPNIYKRYQFRPVQIPEQHKDDVLNSIRALSRTCKENILMLEKELRSNDPDDAERCKKLQDRYVVYAMVIPQCRDHRLAVSVDWTAAGDPPVMLHGVVARKDACVDACELAFLHRDLK